MTDVSLPHNGWLPRDHQMRLWDYLMNGGKRAIAIWHRRAGKDEIGLHFTAVALARRVGNYWHCLPEYNQARKAIWSAVNPHSGKRRIDEAFPHEFRENTNDNEMFIRFKNGSTWQCIGSDQYDRTVGSSCAGLVMSELALSNPSAWGYYRPMLQENDGWSLFITTPRGHNHAKDMYEYAQHADGWFAELLTAHDTGALTPAELADALAEYKALYGTDAGRAAFEQEYECSFNAAILGAFWALECADVRKEGRILLIEPNYERPIDRAWDLGVRDDTAIWWFQPQASGQVMILDYYAASGVGLDHYASEIAKREREYSWISGTDYVPHDAKIKEWTSGRTRVETMQTIGLKPLLVPLAAINDGINAVRRMLPLCLFHPRCTAGFNALEQYRREWNDETKSFRASPLHDWTSHPSDAFRYLATGYKPAPLRVVSQPKLAGFTIPPPAERKQGGIRL